MNDNKSSTNNDCKNSSFKSLEKIAQSSQEYVANLKRNYSGYVDITTGIKSVDKQLGGLHRREVVIIGGRPAMGKTSLLLTIALNAALKHRKSIQNDVAEEYNNGVVVGYYSFSDSSNELALRIYSQLTNISLSDIRRGYLGQEQYNEIAREIQKSQDIPIFLSDDASLNINGICNEARDLYSRHKLDLLIVDDLNFLKSMRDKRQRDNIEEEKLSNAIKALKLLAEELSIAIIVSMPLSRQIDDRSHNRPLPYDLNGPGIIENIADVIIFIYRPEYYHIFTMPDHGDPKEGEWLDEGEKLFGKTELIIAKKKRSWSYIIEIEFNHELSQFRDCHLQDKRDIDDYPY